MAKHFHGRLKTVLLMIWRGSGGSEAVAPGIGDDQLGDMIYLIMGM